MRTKVPFGYYFERLYETAISWHYWFTTPWNELSERGGIYHPNKINWGLVMDDGKIISNFWFMVNDGYYDMQYEWWDYERNEQ